MQVKQKITARQITIEDRAAISNLTHFGSYVHRHLDWRTPLDWIGHPPYEGLEINGELAAILACSPDVPGVSWIRAFACDINNFQQSAWQQLYERAEIQLKQMDIKLIAAIPLQKWFRKILEDQGFDHIHDIITFVWDHAPLIEIDETPENLIIRKMAASDIDNVFKIDCLAFDPLWQHSPELIELAYSQSRISTIAEDHTGPVGYQITTPTSYGFHLGRLAVSPLAQRRGVGYALVRDLQNRISRAAPTRISVNTHDTNIRSIGLYTKAGFSKTKEIFPVFQRNI